MKVGESSRGSSSSGSSSGSSSARASGHSMLGASASRGRLGLLVQAAEGGCRWVPVGSLSAASRRWVEALPLEVGL